MRILGFLWFLALAPACSSAVAVADSQPGQQTVAPAASTPVAAAQPVTTPSVRQTYASAAKHVVKVTCKKTLGFSSGSGFVHKSGLIVTAAHVIDGCKAADLILDVYGWTIVTNKNSYKTVSVKDVVATDATLDLALLRPAMKLDPGLSIVDPKTLNMDIGDTVAFIGYPGGYDGIVPMLGVGYYAAIGPFFSASAKKNLPRAFINGAFNHGNSGGPVLDLQSGNVVGVVHAKVVPIPPDVDSAMQALKGQTSGFMYNAKINGKDVQVTEAQVVESVVEHFAAQTQLVVGVMILPLDVIAFLKANKIAP